jgi:hypothetical protein
VNAHNGISNSGALVRPDELAFTVVSVEDGQPLGKRYWLDDDGELATDTPVPLSRGEANVQYALSIGDFATFLEALKPHQAVLHGIPPVAKARIVTKEVYEQLTPDQRVGVVARTRECFQFAHAPGFLMIDVDPGGAPRSLLEAIASPEHTRELLLRAVPELADAPMLWRPSSSSFLFHGDRELQGLRGQRIYIPVTRATEVSALGNLLFDRLWLLGYGYYQVSVSGQLLERTILDRSVWQPERLDFAAGPVCEPPVERRAGSARLWNPEAPFFEAGKVARLTAQEQRSLESKRKTARSALREAARERRNEWARERGKEIAAARGLDEVAAVAIATEAVERRVLRPDFILVTDDGEYVRVGELLAKPETWDGRRFRDPLEPNYRADSRIAWANLRPTRGRPYIHSHAHGGVRYTLASSRETIRLVEGELPRIVDQCADIILATSEIYQLKDQLTRVTEDGRLASVEPEWIADWLQRNADFVRPKKIDGEWLDRPADLSPKYARTILTKSGEMGLPTLHGITNGPFVRPDGSLVDEPGYDDATHILYWTADPGMPRVRRDMTVVRAEGALRHLWGPFSQFPLESDVDRGCLLALLLTAALRPGMLIAPGGLIESHEAGSGKTLCAQAVANLTGRPANPQAMAQQEEEIRKSLFSVARAGLPSVLFDNVGRDRAVDSASLAMALTSGTIADRILGESTYATVPFRSLILLTGNNTRIAGDLNRRLLRVRITPGVENPWQRVFDFCPTARTEATWPTLRVAAIELVHAALSHGPPLLERASGYPDWDKLVRATVCWTARHLDIGVGFADPARAFLRGYDDDPERDRLHRLLTAWYQVFGAEPKTLRQALDAIELRGLGLPHAGIPDDREDALNHLRDVFAEIDPRRVAQPIGIYLNQQKGRIVDGLKLVSAGKHGGSSRWVVKASAAEIDRRLAA